MMIWPYEVMAILVTIVGILFSLLPLSITYTWVRKRGYLNFFLVDRGELNYSHASISRTHKATNSENRSWENDKRTFKRNYEGAYAYPNEDSLKKEFSRLGDTVYVDHAGATLYSESQIQDVLNILQSSLYANPHSQSDCSTKTAEMIHDARLQVLAFCGASPEEYSCVFTAGATAALKLVGESFPWSHQSHFWYTQENHNSVLGIREFALHSGAAATAVDLACTPEVPAANDFTFSTGPAQTKEELLWRIEPRASMRRAHLSSSGSATRAKVAGQQRGVRQAEVRDWVANDHTRSCAMEGNLCENSEQKFSEIDEHLESGEGDSDSSRRMSFSDWRQLSEHGVWSGGGEAERPSVAGSAMGEDEEGVSVDADACHLFAFPAECNFSGARWDLRVIPHLRAGKHARTVSRGRWMVLLDAAKACGTAPPNLALYPADFVALSFYKIFGLPTGLGALLVRKDAAELLQKRYFGGGTVEASIADSDFVKRRRGVEDWLEDGTASFLEIASLQAGFRALSRFGMPAISKRVGALTEHLAREMLAMRHANGRHVCILYGNHGPPATYFDEESGADPLADAKGQPRPRQGGIVAFNIVRSDGSWVGHREVEKLAGLCNIQLRTGCFCNPGACAKHLGLSHEDLMSNLEAGHVCWDDLDLLHGRPTGGVRVSFGYMSVIDDAQAVLKFISDCFQEGGPSTSAEVALRGAAAAQAPGPEDQGARQLAPTFVSEERECQVACQLEQILVYPIKSCAGFSVKAWPLANTGLLYDREWLLVDSAGQALTQKKLKALCTIKPALDLRKGILTVSCQTMTDVLVLLLDEAPSCHIKDDVLVCGNRTQAFAYGPQVGAWFSKALGVACSLVRQPPGTKPGSQLPSAAQESSPPGSRRPQGITPARVVLGGRRSHARPTRSAEVACERAGELDLVRSRAGNLPREFGSSNTSGGSSSNPYQASPQYGSRGVAGSHSPSPNLPAASGTEQIGSATASTSSPREVSGRGREGLSFANEAQFLLVSSSSVADLNRRLSNALHASNRLSEPPHVDATQFRPNFVVDGRKPYDEDRWHHVSICGALLKAQGGCARCEMVNLNQTSGSKLQLTRQPLLELAMYRRTKGRILFGVLYVRDASSAHTLGDKTPDTEEPGTSEEIHYLRKRYSSVVFVGGSVVAQSM